MPEPEPHEPKTYAFQNAPRCGAKTRAGTPCQNPAMRGRTRCRFHGGASTGPSESGRETLRKLKTTHGGYSKPAQRVRAGMRQLAERLDAGMTDAALMAQIEADLQCLHDLVASHKRAEAVRG